jgi:hypothetical protein
MALTDMQKAEIVFYLGYPGKSIIETSDSYNSTVATKLLNLSADMETLAIRLLTKIKKIDEQLVEALGRMYTKKIEDIELNSDVRVLVRAEKKKYLQELSGLLDIPTNNISGVNFGVCI